MHSTGKDSAQQDSDKARHDAGHLIESITDDVNNTDRLSDTCRDVVFNPVFCARARCMQPTRHISYILYSYPCELHAPNMCCGWG